MSQVIQYYYCFRTQGALYALIHDFWNYEIFNLGFPNLVFERNKHFDIKTIDWTSCWYGINQIVTWRYQAQVWYYDLKNVTFPFLSNWLIWKLSMMSVPHKLTNAFDHICTTPWFVKLINGTRVEEHTLWDLPSCLHSTIHVTIIVNALEEKHVFSTRLCD